MCILETMAYIGTLTQLEEEKARPKVGEGSDVGPAAWDEQTGEKTAGGERCWGANGANSGSSIKMYTRKRKIGDDH